MTVRVSSKNWTDAEIDRLKELCAKGASVARASAALNRRMASVTKMARLHGLTLAGTRQLKAAIRALDENASFSTRD